MDYKEKYLKYKKKYLHLKQIAGAGQHGKLGQHNNLDDPHGLEHHHHGHHHQPAPKGLPLPQPKYVLREGTLVGGAYSEESNYKSEEIDGKKYPPCFKYSGPSRNIYDELSSLGLLEKYDRLMELHSILLCVEMDVRDGGKDCVSSIEPRLTKIGAKSTATPSQQVKDIFKNMKRDKMLEFMSKNGHEVDRHMIGLMNKVANDCNDLIGRLVKETNVTKAAAENFEKMNQIFYSVHFRSIARACNPVKDQYKMDKEKSKVAPKSAKTAPKKAAPKKAAPKKKTASKKKPASKKKAKSKKK